ncbi:hypothetical protein GQ600_4918 [Phytophthora cactorum]|nr:hypothetical protein GQ600_4918 [Phytophthora cactorum]
MTQTWPDSSLALLVVPVVSARIELGDGCHSLEEPSDALLSLPSSMSSVDRGRFWALHGCGAILLPLEPRVYRRRIFVWLRGIRSVYAIPGTDMDEISKSEDNGDLLCAPSFWQNT